MHQHDARVRLDIGEEFDRRTDARIDDGHADQHQHGEEDGQPRMVDGEPHGLHVTAVAALGLMLRRMGLADQRAEGRREDQRRDQRGRQRRDQRDRHVLHELARRCPARRGAARRPRYASASPPPPGRPCGSRRRHRPRAASCPSLIRRSANSETMMASSTSMPTARIRLNRTTMFIVSPASSSRGCRRGTTRGWRCR